MVRVIGVDSGFNLGDFHVSDHPFFESKTITPSLFNFPRLRNRGTKTLHYLSNITVNGFPGIESGQKKHFDLPRQPQFDAVSTDSAASVVSGRVMIDLSVFGRYPKLKIAALIGSSMYRRRCS